MKGLIFTVALTYGGALMSLFKPFYGLLIYVCFAILRPEDMWSWSVQGGNYSRIIALAMLGGWLWHIGLTFLTGKGVNFRLGAGKPVALLFLAFWIWSAFLALNSRHPSHAWAYVETLAKILLPFLVGMTTIDSVKKLKQLAWVIVISQGYVAYELNMYYFGGYNKLWLDGFGGIDNNSVAIALVTVIGIAAFMFLHVEEYWKKAIIGFCGAFMAHAVLFSFSRGGMVALILCALVGFILLKKEWHHYLAFGFAVMAMVYLAGPEVRTRFLRTFETKRGKREASAQSRIDLWADCYTVLKADPIMGCAPNHWPLLAHRFGWPAGKEAHSLWVQTATETGVPGIMMFAGFYLVCIFRLLMLLRHADEDDDPWFGDVARMVTASLAAFGISAQFVSLEALEVPYYVTLLGAATLSVYTRTKLEEQQKAGEAADDYEDEPGDDYYDEQDPHFDDDDDGFGPHREVESEYYEDDLQYEDGFGSDYIDEDEFEYEYEGPGSPR